VRGRDVDPELGHQAGQARGLAFRKVEHEARERGRVDDRVLERALEAPADEPRVEGIVAVLDQDGALREAEKPTAHVLELGGTDEHRAVDVVSPPGVRVDRGAAVDEGVEERQRLVETEPFGADLEDEERRVAGRLDVERDELRVAEACRSADLGRVDRDLVPRDRLDGAAGLEVEAPLAHVRAAARARRAQRISSPVRPRRSRTAEA
jgi:hypothetical protein